MQIPSAEGLGNAIAPPTNLSGAMNPGAFGQQIAGGVMAVGQELLQRERVADQEQKAIALQQQRAKAALTMATLTNDLHDSYDEVSRGVMDGSIPTGNAQRSYSERVDQLKKDSLAGLPPDQTDAMNAHVISVAGSLNRNLGGVVLKRNQSETAATLDQLDEESQRDVRRIGPKAASEKYGIVMDFGGPLAGLTAQQIAAKKQMNRERTTLTYFDGEGLAALTRGDANALGSLMGKVLGPDGEVLDPTRRDQLAQKMFGWQQHIVAKQVSAANAAERQQRDRENNAGDMLNKGMELFQQGKTFDADFIAKLTESAAGTPHQVDVLGLLAVQATGAGFAARSATERDAMLANADRVQSDPAMGTNPAQSKAVDVLRSMNSKIKAQAAENPWTAWQSVGGKAVEGINLADPSAALSVIDSRMAVIGQLETWTGKRESPFQPQEVDQIGKQLKALPPDASATLLSAMGQKLQQPDRIAMVAKQLGSTSDVNELMMLAAGDKTTSGRYSAELIARGAQAIADKTIKRDESVLTGWKAEIAGLVNGTMSNPQDEDRIKRAAYYVRAAMEDGTAVAPGYEFKTTATAAVALVVGAPIERQGIKTLLPRGMKEGHFDDALAKFTSQRLAAESPTGKLYSGGREVPSERVAAQLGSMGLRRWSGDTYVPISNGRPITTDAEGTQPLKLKVQ